VRRPETEFDSAEGDILIAIYEWPDVPFSTYTLTQRLNPSLQISTPEYRTAFAHVGSAIEEHIVRGLIRGKRSRGTDGVFFEHLKLTPKGERAAIQERDRRASSGRVNELLEVVERIKEQRNRGGGS
jgi:hypothetical protein